MDSLGYNQVSIALQDQHKIAFATLNGVSLHIGSCVLV